MQSVRQLVLDASTISASKQVEIIREEVQKNRIRFIFPQGFTEVPLVEECRVLGDINNFDLVFDLVMQKLVGKPVQIALKDAKGVERTVAAFVVTDRYMNLRGVELLNEYPVIVMWLCEFMQGHLLKKFPLPPESWSEETEEEKVVAQLQHIAL